MSKFDLTKDIPYIHNKDQLRLWLKPVYMINRLLENKEEYKKTISQIMNLLRGSFTIRSCREYPVRFKLHEKDQDEYHLQLRHFAINLILWYPFTELGDIIRLDKSFIFDCNIEVPSIENFLNYKLITVLDEYTIKPTKIHYLLSEVLYYLRHISIDFSIIMGLNFSGPTFFDMYEKHEEVREIMETQFPETMQPYDIEQTLNQLQDREVEIYKKEGPGNPIAVLLTSRTGVKLKQFAEFTIADGLKPTLDGKTIPKPIENSTLLRGLDRPSYLYIAATAARKSLVMNKRTMGKAGYFGKIVLLLTRTLSMTTDVSDCGTKNLVEYEIKNKTYLKKLNGKFYKLNEDDPDFSVVSAKDDMKLIGKKIRVRSAATCALGDCVCPKCIGLTATANMDIADGLSAFESEEITKVINQNILSAKHLLQTNSEVINFLGCFYDFFTIMAGEINPIINDNTKVKNIEDYAIYIDPEDIERLDDQDSDSLFNTSIANGRFYIRNIKNPEEEDILIQAEGEKEIFISEEALELMKKGKGLIYFKDLDDDVKLFEMAVLNKELTAPLYGIMELLNKQKKEDIDETINSISQKFLDLIIDSKIEANVIAAELIINRLIRSSFEELKYERPDFLIPNQRNYKIITVSKALEKNKSPLIGLSFQNLKRQILSDELYEERDGTSFIDPFFWTNIPTSNLKKYAKLAEENEGEW